MACNGAGAESAGSFTTKTSARTQDVIHQSTLALPWLSTLVVPQCEKYCNHVQQQKGNVTTRGAIKDRAIGEWGSTLGRMTHVPCCGSPGRSEEALLIDVTSTVQPCLGDIACNGWGIVIGVTRAFVLTTGLVAVIPACGACSFGFPGNGRALLRLCATVPQLNSTRSTNLELDVLV